jgi:DNA polymerase-1
MLPFSRPMRFVLDLEANGLLKEVTKVHCLVLKDIDTKELFSFADHAGYTPISIGLRMIEDASLLIGHNILCYDMPVLRKVYNITFSHGKIRDTLLMSRIRWPEIAFIDKSDRYFIPNNLMGDYSLEAFGYRLGEKKGDFKGPWDIWSPVMQRYCEQDVEVTYKLYNSIIKKPIAEKCLEIEHEFQEYIHIQETLGVPFDVVRAHELNTPLVVKINEVKANVAATIPPWKIQLKTKVRYEQFNPGSRTQIIRFFSEKYDWKPVVFSDKGNPTLDGDVLESLPYPEARVFAEYFELQKLLGMLSTGANSWLNFVREGRIHGRVVTCGAITRRCTHSSPNLGQIPSVRSFMGKEVRSLFYAPSGYRMVGADLSGVELRCLSHYLACFDNGAYGREVVDGDIHTRHRHVVELPTRDHAKTFIYAFIYGAGDETLGEIFKPSGTQAEKIAAGKKARFLFGERIPAYRQLQEKLRAHLVNNTTIAGIDGGSLHIRQKYSALNTILQNAGSVAAKKATVLSYKAALAKGLEVYPALHVHDEWQSITKLEDAEEHGKLKVQAIKDAGEEIGFKVPLTGEYKIGQSWMETH